MLPLKVDYNLRHFREEVDNFNSLREIPSHSLWFSSAPVEQGFLLKDLRLAKKHACTTGKDEDKARRDARGLKGQSEEMARKHERGQGQAKRSSKERTDGILFIDCYHHVSSQCSITLNWSPFQDIVLALDSYRSQESSTVSGYLPFVVTFLYSPNQY